MRLNRKIEPAARSWHHSLTAGAGWLVGCALLAALLAGCGVFVISITPDASGPGGTLGTPEPSAQPSGPQPGAPGALPETPNKPKPTEITFQGCPPAGDGGDSVLNDLKNRVDSGSYVPVLFDAVEMLKWPAAIERQRHSNWSASDAAQVARYEGDAISVEGYLAGAREEGPESPNCHGADLEQHDFHLWLTKSAGQDRTAAIVVEMTPRVRQKHASWRIDVLTGVSSARSRVRVSGWLMLDPEHPDQLGKTRGTIWEIHPILQLEVQQQGRWVPLDDYAH